MIESPSAVTLLWHAVSYLRVSTQRQMDTAIDIDPDGNSIATQRQFVDRRATSVQAVIDKEFLEPGTSAQSIEKRPKFKELLAYLAEHPEIKFVIIYMRSRAFRNYTDAAITKRRLAKLGVKLISAKEDFGEGYVADAMEGIIDIFNELEVRRNSEDIKAKMRNKVANGGTNGRAKLGYLNARAEQNGHLYNTINLDEQRAPLVLKVFELYASGDYSIERLEATMADLGLTTRPSGRHPQEQPVSASKLHAVLTDPYYAGWVSLDGQLIRGRHTAIVSQDLFDRVQAVRAIRSSRGNRDRVLQHYLKGMAYCDRCYQQRRISRLIYTEAKGRNGRIYGYFLCRARQEGLCDLPHLPSWQVEEAIESHYATLQLPEGFADLVRAELDAALRDQQQLTQELHDQQTKQLAKLEAREQRLLDLAADGLLSRSKILERSNAIQIERVHLEASLAGTTSQLAVGAERLRHCLELVANPTALYLDAPDQTRQQLNRTFFERFYLNDHPLAVSHSDHQPPFDEINEAATVYQRYQDPAIGRRRRNGQPALTTENCPGQTARAATAAQTPVLADIFPAGVSSKWQMVVPAGLEPATPSL